MSRYAAAIADLERRRDLIIGALNALKALEALGDDSAGVVRSRAGMPAAPKLTPPPKRRTDRTPGPKPGVRHGLKVTPEGWARARVLWDAMDSAEKIGKVIGCTGARVNQKARERKWPTRDYGTVARKARLKSLAAVARPRALKAAAPPPAPLPPPRVRPKRRSPGTECPKCHLVTPSDPCICGARK